MTSLIMKLVPLRYSIVSNFILVGFLYNCKSRELATTETELRAIAADPIQGSNLNPKGLNTPAATGIPTILYIDARTKFSHILRTVRLDRSKQPITSTKSF